MTRTGKAMLIAAVVLTLALTTGGYMVWQQQQQKQLQAASNNCPDTDKNLLGLCWGVTLKTLEEMNLVLTRTEREEGGYLVLLKQPATPLDLDITDITATVTEQSGLRHVSITSEPIVDDISGQQAQQRFQHFHQLLSRQLGKPAHELYKISRATDTGEEELLPANYFYACLTRPDGECSALWGASWVQEGTVIANLDLINQSHQKKDGSPYYAASLLIDLERPPEQSLLQAFGF